jgi:hydrogenase 3 maturation protease
MVWKMLSFKEELLKELKDSNSILILGMGDELNPTDKVGIEAVKKIKKLKLNKIKVLLTGTSPENFTNRIRKLNPSHLIIIDSTEMNEEPGTIKIVDKDKITGQNFSTHSLSLLFLIEYVERSIGSKVLLVGIEPTKENDYKKIQESIQELADAFITYNKT